MRAAHAAAAIAFVMGCGCQPFGPKAQYQCTRTADCDGTAYPVCDVAKNMCVASDGGNGTTHGTSGASTGTSMGNGSTTGSTTGATTSSSSGSAGLVVPTFSGAAITQLVPAPAGMYAVGTSLWFSDGGAWSEILDAPEGDAGSLLELAENESAAVCGSSGWDPYQGFSVVRLLANQGVLVVQIDVSADAGQASNTYERCSGCSDSNMVFTPTWQPLRQYTPDQYVPDITSAALSEGGGAFFAYSKFEGGYLEAYTMTGLAGIGSPTRFFDGGWDFPCGAVAADPVGPAFVAAFATAETAPSIDGGPAVWLLADDGAGGYLPDASVALPATYRPNPDTGSCAAGSLGPLLGVALDGGGSVAFVGGGADDGGVAVWAVPFNLPGAPSQIATLPAGSLQLALGPGGVWMASGQGVAIASLAPPFTAMPTAGAPDFVTALGSTNVQMLAGTGNGILDITALFDAGVNGGAQTGPLDGTELDLFSQGGTTLYALSGAQTKSPQLLAVNANGLQTPLPIPDSAGPCTQLVATYTAEEKDTAVLICDGGAYAALQGTIEPASPVMNSGVITIQGGMTVFQVDDAGDVSDLSFSAYETDVSTPSPLSDMDGPVRGPVWASPAFAGQSAAYAYNQDGGFDVLDGLATVVAASVTRLIPGSTVPSPPVAGAVDPNAASIFVLPDLRASALVKCTVTDGGASAPNDVRCAMFCSLASTGAGEIDLQFDAQGNLWALTHVPVGAPLSKLLENQSQLYAIPAADLLGDGGLPECPAVRLQFVTPDGGAPLSYASQLTCNSPAVETLPIQEGLLGFSVSPFSGGPILFRGTRHPLECLPQQDAGFLTCALSILP